MAKEAVDAASSEAVARARKIVESHPELAPEAEPRYVGVNRYFSAGLEPWPEETKRVWKRVFLKEPPRSGTRTYSVFG
jgi:hypothetical protein